MPRSRRRRSAAPRRTCTAHARALRRRRGGRRSRLCTGGRSRRTPEACAGAMDMPGARDLPAGMTSSPVVARAWCHQEQDGSPGQSSPPIPVHPTTSAVADLSEARSRQPADSSVADRRVRLGADRSAFGEPRPDDGPHELPVGATRRQVEPRRASRAALDVRTDRVGSPPGNRPKSEYARSRPRIRLPFSRIDFGVRPSRARDDRLRPRAYSARPGPLRPRAAERATQHGGAASPRAGSPST